MLRQGLEGLVCCSVSRDQGNNSTWKQHATALITCVSVHPLEDVMMLIQY